MNPDEFAGWYAVWKRGGHVPDFILVEVRDFIRRYKTKPLDFSKIRKHLNRYDHSYEAQQKRRAESEAAVKALKKADAESSTQGLRKPQTR